MLSRAVLTAPAEVTLRDVLPEDEPWLAALYATTRDDLQLVPEPQRQRLVDFQFRAQQQQYVTNWPNARNYIVSIGAEPAGRMIVAHGGSEMRLVDIALLPTHRGQGIAGSLIGDLIAEARRERLPLRLSVMNNNPARRLYERLGFVAIDESDLHVEMEKAPE